MHCRIHHSCAPPRPCRSNQIAKINGTGSVGFSDSIFNAFDAKNTGQAAIQLYGGDVTVRGCIFQSAHRGGQVLLAPGSRRAIITDNLIAGAMNITNAGAKGVVVIANNADEA